MGYRELGGQLVGLCDTVETIGGAVGHCEVTGGAIGNYGGSRGGYGALWGQLEGLWGTVGLTGGLMV